MTASLEAHIIELELQLQSPSLRSRAEAIDALLADDFQEFGASGRIWTRSETLAELAVVSPPVLISENFECKPLSSDLILLTYGSRSPNRTTLRSSLWRLEGGRWRIFFHQGTIVPTA